MKAVEYYKIFKDNEDKLGLDEAIKLLAYDMFLEVGDIAASRKARYDNAMISVFKEQESKWYAICKLDERFRRDGFREYIKLRMPDVAEMVWARSSPKAR